MTAEEFKAWRARFHVVFPTNTDPVFARDWLTAKAAGVSLEMFDLDDALAAIATLQADKRITGAWPPYYLPWILEILATAKREEIVQPVTWSESPGPSEAWDRRMVEIGAISKTEFAKRQAKRKGRDG